MSATQSFSLDEVVEALRSLFYAAQGIKVIPANPDALCFALDKARAVLAKVSDV